MKKCKPGSFGSNAERILEARLAAKDREMEQFHAEVTKDAKPAVPYAVSKKCRRLSDYG